MLVLLALVLATIRFQVLETVFGRGPLDQRELATQYLGRYLAANYPGKRAIVLSNPFSNQPGQPAEVYQYEKAGLRGLRRGLGGAVQIQQVVFPDVKTGALANPRSVFIDPATPTPLSYLIADGALDKIAREYPGAELVVSLIGLPANIQRAEIWKADNRRSFAVLLPDVRLLGGAGGIREAVKAGKISVLILNKPGAPAERPMSRDARMEFDERFLLVTPETVDEYVRLYPRLFNPRVTN